MSGTMPEIKSPQFRIDADWACRPVADLDLETIHFTIFGKDDGSAGVRTTEFVKDFGGEPPTRVSI